MYIDGRNASQHGRNAAGGVPGSGSGVAAVGVWGSGSGVAAVWGSGSGVAAVTWGSGHLRLQDVFSLPDRPRTKFKLVFKQAGGVR